MKDGRRAYRYYITETWGDAEDKVEVGSHVLDWSYLGAEYTWKIYKTDVMEMIGSFTGVFVDKGHLRGRKFVSDAEAA